jgi:antitoxin VapB
MPTAKLFKNGRSQAVRLPREFALPGREVYVQRVGEAVLLVPIDDPWTTLFDAADRFSDDFMTEREQPEVEERESL